QGFVSLESLRSLDDPVDSVRIRILAEPAWAEAQNAAMAKSTFRFLFHGQKALVTAACADVRHRRCPPSRGARDLRMVAPHHGHNGGIRNRLLKEGTVRPWQSSTCR